MALCITPGCGKPTYNGQPGQKCRKSCGVAAQPSGGAFGSPPTCITPGCGKPTYNGQPGHKCVKSCGGGAPSAGPTGLPTCIMPGCNKPTYNGKPAEKCSKGCNGNHTAPPVGGVCCITPGCGKPSYNGQAGQKCGKSCGTCATHGCDTPVATAGDKCGKGCDLCITPGCGKPSFSGKKGEKCALSCAGLDPEAQKQFKLGGQSSRGIASADALLPSKIKSDPHAYKCFKDMLEREHKLSAHWVAFYHSYTTPAVLYEMNAAIAGVLFLFGAGYSCLPRILVKDFQPPNPIADAPDMVKRFPTWKDRDHNNEFKTVGICVTTSLVSKDPEATPTDVWDGGYGVGKVTESLLEKLLKDCGYPGDTKKIAKDMMDCAMKHGLPQVTGKGLQGHMLQIFIHRTEVDKWAYSALPYGVPDPTRAPLSKALAGDGPIMGQARITCNPEAFLDAKKVRLYSYSADEKFHKARHAFHAELCSILNPILIDEPTRTKAATGVYGGKLPPHYKDMKTLPKCITPNCGKPTYNNKVGEKCTLYCGGLQLCTTSGCGKPSYNGKAGHKCSTICPQCINGCIKVTSDGKPGGKCSVSCFAKCNQGCGKPTFDLKPGGACDKRCTGKPPVCSMGCGKPTWNNSFDEKCTKSCVGPVCIMGCGKPTFNKQPGEKCSRSCVGAPPPPAGVPAGPALCWIGCGRLTWNGLPGGPCSFCYHQFPQMLPPTTNQVQQPSVSLCLCGQPTWNGAPGQCLTCTQHQPQGYPVPSGVPLCYTPGCGKPTWNGLVGQCTICASSAAPAPTAQPWPTAPVAVCITPGCGQVTFNGLPGYKCRKSCGNA